MPRILAIDYGLKRTGIAVTDPLQIISHGLTTVATETAINFLKKYCSTEIVSDIVIGEPKKLDNTNAEIEPFIQLFIEELKAALPNITFHRFDERFTSKLAAQSIYQSGLKKKQRHQKELLDEVSATILLQSFMETRT